MALIQSCAGPFPLVMGADFCPVSGPSQQRHMQGDEKTSLPSRARDWHVGPLCDSKGQVSPPSAEQVME